MKLSKLASTFLILALMLSAMPAQPVYAATLVVESNADTGGTPASCGVGDGCTLRQARYTFCTVDFLTHTFDQKICLESAIILNTE